MQLKIIIPAVALTLALSGYFAIFAHAQLNGQDYVVVLVIFIAILAFMQWLFYRGKKDKKNTEPEINHKNGSTSTKDDPKS